jgi:hypothetical protein
MKPKILLAIALSLQLITAGQQKFKFENTNQIGLISGSLGNALQLQTVNGISYRTFFVGLGIGVDNYYFRTIPLFADVRKNIFEKEQTPFVYVDAGSNFPWKKDETTTWQQTTYQAGLYYDVGIGYKWTILKHFCVNARFGFSQKKYASREEYHYTPLDPEVPPDRYNYRLQRFLIKFGLGF